MTKHLDIRTWLARPETRRITLHSAWTKDADDILASIKRAKAKTKALTDH
jgi:hypothetical protein